MSLAAVIAGITHWHAPRYVQYLRDRGVERYMDPEALRHEIEVVMCEVLAGAAALAKPATKKFGVRKIGGES
jgi:hypothetical protein